MAPSRSPTSTGAYRRMFPELPRLPSDEAFLHKLGTSCGVEASANGKDDASGAAGWPFFGQFIAHDVTADRSALVDRADIEALKNVTAPEAESRVPLRLRPDRRTLPVRRQRLRQAPHRPQRCGPGGGSSAQCPGHRDHRRSPERLSPADGADAGAVLQVSQSDCGLATREGHGRTNRFHRSPATGRLALPVDHPAGVSPRPDR